MQQSEFQQQALKLAGQQHAPDYLQALRHSGAAEFACAPWPGRKSEHWKYTPLMSLQAFAEAGLPKALDTVPTSADLQAMRSEQYINVIFVDGVFNADASDALPAGVSLFSQAGDEAQQILQQHLGKIASQVASERRNLFAALNNAQLTEGVLVTVAKNTTLDKPLNLIYLSSAVAGDLMANTRVLIVLEQGANAKVIEQYLSADDATDSFANSLTEIAVGENARLHHTRLHLEHEDSRHIGGVHVNLQRSAVFEGFTLAEGGRLKRIDYQINHGGEGGEAILNGVYLARHQQLVDYHTTIEHRVPHCTSNEVFRGIVGDKAKAVFNGRIHIHEDAQKTLAELNNRNLLTSNSAEVDTKPELEIYADDVRCAHGATISQLDDTALYYLQSRGVERQQATMMLSYGFINEVMMALPYADMLDTLQTRLRQRFIEESSID
ncbi:Fe-S cluster assembly protein SufD [Pseudohongiella spirulinae]|uniref:FeS assembly protein SufD n=1 Tax=Pseudohongiella spirulinae TaxID=1249552 RepID=A0A0S2KCU3_9GAMM|nr:Fe-S cluster assembly protein SufD [Pseudohongiella spirulinae]ALO45923.1 FeS assembly protein SufD [Pseudohongiella spirulinae]